VNRALKIAIVGAESTGKSVLALALADALAEATGLRVTAVPEWLRLWCEREGRTPRPDEQAAIAMETHARIDTTAAVHDIVVCDTTALMTTVYSDLLFADRSLDAMAMAHQRTMDITLLTALDLPWVADGHQRDGPHVREPVDQRLRWLLNRHAMPYSLVLGQGSQRLQSALDALQPWWPQDLLRRASAAMGDPGAGHMGISASGSPMATELNKVSAKDAANPEATAYRRWQQACARCGDPACERASRLLR
jgi:nicotinamide riboside kinase